MIALSGAFVGWWLKARTDVDQWRRDKRLNAYEDLARTITEFLVAANAVPQGPQVVPSSPENPRR